MSKQPTEEFAGLRKLLWPIHNHELKKVLPMAFIMFAILFNYTLLRDTKDTIVVAATKGSAVIPTLKLWFVTPMAILFVMAYVKLSNIFSREKMFYITLTPLIAYFVLYAYVIYPNLSSFQPSDEVVAGWKESFPSALHGFLIVFQNWAHSLFYVLAEIWGSAGIALLFWQFANEVTKTNEAKRIYVFYGLIANISLIFSGQYVKYFSDIKDKVAPGVDPWQVSLNWLIGGVLVFGIIAMAIYRWVNTSVLTDPRFAPEPKEPKKKKEKPGLGESLKIVFQSRYLMLIAVLVMAYGITINLVEVTWKEQLRLQYPTKNDYNAFMGDFSTVTGIVTMLFMIVGSNILRAFKWTTAAIITPMLILCAGALFFAFILFRESIEPLLSTFGLTTVFAAALLGAGLVIISKGIKYALFDPTKEMAYIPLDDDLKAKGKAVVDVVGGRAGKAGGSLILWLLLNIIFQTSVVSEAAFVVAIVFLVISFAWVYSVKALGRQVEDAAAKNEKKTA